MRLSLFAAIAFCVSSLAARADTLAGTTAGTSTNFAGYYGQSFTTLGAGTYTDITFGFESSTFATYASGTGYLFSSPYTGLPSALSSSDTGFLGEAASFAGLYSFGSSVSLSAGQTYFFYEDRMIPSYTITGGSSYAGEIYFTSSPTSNFTTTLFDASNFEVTGQSAVTPEPSSIALLGTGVLGLAGLVRKRFA